jgi:hypothetical protein
MLDTNMAERYATPLPALNAGQPDPFMAQLA